VAIGWFLLCIWDVLVQGRGPVGRRFDTIAVLGITAAVAAIAAVPTGMLWRHYRREGSYYTTEQMFFGIWFGLFLWVAVLGGVGFLFAD
jgi:hypothetical protein